MSNLKETHPSPKADFSAALSYMKTAKLILKDLERNQKESSFYKKYKKEDVIRWLENPAVHERELRNASIYLYHASNHYKRLINYFSKMALFSYMVIPSKIDTEQVDLTKFKKCYRNTLNFVDNMNLKHEFLKIMNTVFREDIFYGYEYSSKDSYFIKKLPPDYCQISSTEDGVLNFAFDFGYFDNRKDKLDAWGEEFQTKYKLYQKNSKLKWQEIESRRSICIKLNEDIDYPIPPFIGVLGTLFDLEDYKSLKKVKEEIGNYKLLSLKIPLDDDGNYQFDYNEALKFYHMLGAVLPENIGLALTPLELDEHSFEQSKQAASDAVAEAEDTFWGSTGVSALLFSSTKSGASVINNSIKSDEEIVFALLRQFERWMNFKLKCQPGIYKFKLLMMDATIYNKNEILEQLIKNAAYGIPVVSAVSAVLGFSPSDTNAIMFLENDVLQYHSKLIPLANSHSMSVKESDKKSGRPALPDEELQESSLPARERDEPTEKLVN